MLRLIAALVLFFGAFGTAQAQTACTIDLGWNAPTQNTDGSALTNLAGFNVYCDTGAVPGTFVGQATPGSKTTFSWACPGPGTYRCGVTAYNTAGGVSAMSNIASKTIGTAPPVVPNPPTNLKVLASNLTAYTVVKQRDKFVMLPVGSVPADTQCVADQSVNGYHVVPRDSVTWSGNVRPEVVVGQCS